MERINYRIGRIKEYASIIESIKDECLSRFRSDPIYRGALLHYLYLLADCCIVLAEQVIRKKGLRNPQSYAESFDILGENKILESEFAYRFAGIAGFRNFLAHDYESVDPEPICANLGQRLSDVEIFLDQIQDSLDLKDKT